MSTRDRQRDRDDQDALFRKVVALLDAKRAADPTITDIARFPGAFLLGHKGHLLYFQQGTGRTIGFGQIGWRSDGLAARLHEMSIVRSKKCPSLFQLNRGPARDLEVIATDFVESFFRESGELVRATVSAEPGTRR